MLKLSPKDPEEILDYTVSFTDWLVGTATLIGGTDTTVTQDGTSVPSALTNLTVSGVTAATDKVTFVLTGGTAGETYTFKVKTADNTSPKRVGVRRAKIKISLK